MAARKETFDVLLKLLLLGDSGVGKSSLLTSYVEDDFHDVFISTIGIDFRNKTLDIGGTMVKLRIWDTAGQERFRTLTAQFYRGSQGILLVYDMTNRDSFDNVNHWMEQIQKNTEGDPRMVLVANKCDCTAAERKVKKREGEKLAKQYGVHYFETSAKTQQGVHECFQHLAEQVVRYQKQKDLAKARGHASGAAKTTKKGGSGSGSSGSSTQRKSASKKAAGKKTKKNVNVAKRGSGSRSQRRRPRDDPCC